MKKSHPQLNVSEQMMHTLRHRLRLPVTVLMIASNLAFSLQSNGEVLVKTNSGSNTYLSPTIVLPGAHYADNSEPTASDILLFKNDITAASTFRISTVANSTLAVQGLRVWNPGGIITLQNNASQSQTLRIGSAGIDLSRATQNLVINNNTGGTMTLALDNAGAATWSVAQGRTLQVVSNITGSGTGLTINPGINGLGGTVNLGGANTFTGATTVNNSALILDYTTAANRIDSGSSLNLNRGTVTVQGGATFTQVVNGLNLGSGLNQILRGGTTASINVGAINRPNQNALLNVNSAGFFTTSQANVNGMLGGWAVFNNTDWLVGNGAATASALTAYTDRTGTWTAPAATNNVRITGSVTAVGAGTINSLKFNSGAFSVTQTAGTTLNIASGGILKNDNNASSITGGSLTAGGTANGAADSLYIWQAQNTMTITSNIVNNGADVVNVVKAGASELLLNGTSSTYTGTTTVANGRLTIGNAGAINKAGNIEIYGNSGADNTGSLRWNTTTTDTITGNITGAAGTDALRHTLQKLNSGVLILNPTVANTYFGSTLIDAGVLRAGKANAFSANSRFQFANVATAVLDLAGFNNTIRGLAGGGATGGNVTLGAGNLTLQNLENDLLSYSGIISGTGGLIKEGAGTQTFTANQTFTGPLNVNEGVLITSALATTNVTVNAGGTLQAGNLTSATSLNVNGNGLLQMKAGGNLAASPTVSLNGDGSTLQLAVGVTQNFGTLTSAAGSRILIGAGTSDSNLTFTDNAGGTNVIRGVIAMSGTAGAGKGNIIKTGSTNWELAGGNAYTGSTTINGGTLSISPSALVEVLPDLTALTLANASGVGLDLNGKSETIGSLSGGGASGGNVSLDAGRLTVGGNGATTTYAGIISGSGSLVKTGNGIMTLSGANTFTGGLEIQRGTLVLARTGGNTLANNVPVTLNGMNARLEVNTSQIMGALNAGPNTTVSIASGATLTTTQTAIGSVVHSGNLDAETRVIELTGLNAAANLRPGMSVNIPGVTGVYITQVLAGNQILVNKNIGADSLNTPLTFGTVGEMSGTLEGEGNWTKTGAGRTVLSGKNTLSGTMTLAEGSLQVGGVSSGGRNWIQDIIDDEASLVFSDTLSTTLDFSNNVAATLPFERIGSIGGGVSNVNINSPHTTINLSGEATHMLLAVGGNDATTTFKGSILGGATSVFVKEGNGTLTWQSDRPGAMLGTVRVESGGLAVTGAQGLSTATRLAISNKPGAFLELATDASQSVVSLVGGGRGAVTTYANGVLGALGGAYLSGTGGEVRLVDLVSGDSSLPTLTLNSTAVNTVLRYGGAITGNGNLSKDGPNILELLGDNTYSGSTTIQAATASSTNSIVRLGAYGTSSGVGILASSGFGSLPSTTRLQLNAGNDGTARNVAFDLNGATQTISSLASSFEVGTRTVFLRGGNLTINAQGTDTSGTFNGSFDGPGIINVLATLDPNGETDGWRLSGDSNLSQTGSFNIQGGKVTLDRPGGTMGDRVDVKVNNTGVLVAQQSDVIGSLSGNGNVSINSGHTLTISAAPAGGVAANPWSGTITGLGGLTLATGGSMRLTSAQSYLGGTTLNTGSALYLDYGSTAPQIIPGTLNLNGGNIYLTGDAGQTIANTIIGSGLTSISTKTGDDPKAKLQLNIITRDTTVLAGGVNPGSGGGVLQIRGASVSTSQANKFEILGGYATYHAVDLDGNPVVSWAKSNGAGVPINGLTNFVTDLDAASEKNLDIIESGGLFLSGNAGSIRFNNPADVTLNLETATRIQSGGILVTPNVGPNDIIIDSFDIGSSITGGDSNNSVRRELIIHQYNTRGSMTINVPIVDNGQATRLTKVGQGKLILTQINGYNGQTSILGGVLELADNPNEVNASKGSLGNQTGSYAIQNFGYLAFNRSGSTDVYEVNNDIIGSGVIRKMNSGSVALRGSNSSYTGPTQVLGGKLSVGTDRGLGSTDGLTSVGPLGILELRGVNSLENVVLNGGILAAGVGASTLSGSLTLTSGSTLMAPSTGVDLILAGPVTAYPDATLTTAGDTSSGGKIILTNANNQLGNITLGTRTSLQIGNNTNGSVGRGVITTGNNTNVITNTSNSQLVFGAKITGSGNFIQARNTVFLTQDNDYSGTTTIGGNGSVGIQNLVANLRVGADTYTGSVGTGAITIQAGNGGDSWLRYHLLKSVTLANDITINPILEGASTLRFAGLNRYSLGSMQLTGKITAGSHGISDQRAILQTEGGGGKMVLTGTIENGESNSLNINNNGNFVFANEDVTVLNQDLWGVVAGGGVYTFRSTGSITLKGINTFNSSNYIKKGTLIVDNSAGQGLNDDNDFYLSRDAQIHFNFDETTGLISTMRGSLIRLNNGANLTLDDNVTVGNFGDITGEGTLNISANGGAAWVGLFGTNDLNTPANIGSTNQTTTVRVNSLPMTGMVSSLGTNYNINLGVLNGTGETRLEYIGLGETTDRGINLTGGASTVRIAGSGKGALILNGPITIINPGDKTLMLHGQTIGNTVNGQIDEAGSVLSLSVNPNIGNTDTFGLGRWILTNATNNFSGNVTVGLGVLELAGNLGNGTGTSSVFGDLTATREISLGTGNFDGRKFDVFGGTDNLGGATGLGSTGTIVFNDPNAGTATFSSLITFIQSYNSTNNPGNGELVNNGNKVVVFNGTFTSGDSGPGCTNGRSSS
ncbi:MAG: autotransporter-associated beta strand repeat-containing protein, partial [Verrucomicrobiota bacterium]